VSTEIAWHDAGGHADTALAAHVASVLGEGDVRTGRLCPRCGSADHGQPWARLDGRSVSVSLSRSGPHLVTAVGGEGRIGIDVEEVAEVAARWQAALVLAPGEEAPTSEDQARTWARKEAILKAYAVGLDEPMTGFAVSDFDGELHDLPAPEGFVAALAVVSSRRGAPAGPAGRSGTTTSRTGP